MAITSEIADLIQRGGQIQGQGELQRGQIWGNFLTNLAGVPAQIQRAKTERQAQQVQQLELTERQRQLQAQGQLRSVLAKYGGDLDRPGAMEEITAIDPDLGMKIKDRAVAAKSRALEYQSMQLKHQQAESEFQAQLLGSATDEPSYQEAVLAAKHAGLDVSKLPPTYDPHFVEGVQKAGLTAKEQLSLKMQAVDDQRQELARQDAAKKNAAVEDETKRHNEQMEQRQHELAMAQIANIGADNQRQAAAALEAARHNKAVEGLQGQANAIRAARPAAGSKPRNVTSGDANRIADYNSSLADLQKLKTELTNVAGATGAAAKAGAMLPNAITEYTGIGQQAKQKQAVIDRVKQVIGKAMEGGVLRKEDEYKYEKILPTIGDPPAVVTAKLRGLEAAITQRRQTQLDALEDAGYDTSRYRARDDTPATAAPAKKANPFRK